MDDANLEQRIETMSTWTGGERGLCEAALADERRRGAVVGFVGRVRERVAVRGVAAGLVAAAGLAVVLVGAFGGDAGQRPNPRVFAGLEFSEQADSGVRRGLDRARMRAESQRAYQERVDQQTALGRFGLDRAGSGAVLGVVGDSFDPSVGQETSRQIAYSASVRLVADDVQMLTDRARELVDAAGGEYIQTVSVSGEGSDATARLTLRVRADRLEGVLAAIRGLGDVVGEEVSAQDLSDRLVDLEARLRNERRTEAELLELMSTREEIDLEGLVRLRSELGRVRERIETMDASRVNAERLVALATIELRIVGRQPLPEVTVESGWQRFWTGVGAYWDRGVGRLGRSLGGVLSFLVGGVLWWLPGLLLVGLGWRVWRRGQSG